VASWLKELNLSFSPYKSLLVRAITQVVILRFPNMAAQVRWEVRSCGIFDWGSCSGTGFLRVHQFPLPVFISPTIPYLFTLAASPFHNIFAGSQSSILSRCAAHLSRPTLIFSRHQNQYIIDTVHSYIVFPFPLFGPYFVLKAIKLKKKLSL
jgi:hypothetical protein